MKAYSKWRGTPGQPAGGYEPIRIGQLAMAWWAYSKGHISKFDLRCWFACWELEVRRRLTAGRYKPNAEGLRQLVGGPDDDRGRAKVRTAVKKLRATGVLRSCTARGITFAKSPDELCIENRSTLTAMFAEFKNPNRKVPIPRRVIRRLAGGLSRSRTATVIAHLIRCLFYKKGQGCTPTGCCKASWIARVFGVTERSVYDARRYLIEEMGWLVPEGCSQRTLNRDGLWVTINLAWGPEGRTDADAPESTEPTPVESTEPEAARAEVPRNGFSGPPAVPVAEFSGPIQDKTPLTGTKNQKPARGEPGVSVSSATDGKPSLFDITMDDLRDSKRLDQLHKDAVDRKLINASEADRLKFFAGAAHSMAIGKKPPSLFAWMVWKRRWECIAQADEDEAVARLKAMRRAQETPPRAEPGRAGGEKILSNDAKIVRDVREMLRQIGIHVDPFATAQARLSDWTRERWDAAILELDGPTNRPLIGLGGLLGNFGGAPMSLSNR